MRLRLPLYLALMLASTVAFAQPTNDDCENPFVIVDVTNWCSADAEFTNVDATDSGYGPASCFSGASNDVWFTFTPIATDVTITIVGNTNQGSGGSLSRPEVALYRGDCGGTINEEQCETDAAGNNVIELYKGGLAPGLPYLIRVQGRNGNTGTFKICINNYNPPVNPGSDCFTEAVLCNKEQFVVQQVIGPGADPSEANDADCLNGFPGNVESNSTWFAWTAANNGTLTFTLTPLSPADDLDFVLYRLDGEPQDCSDKTVLRCMASGDFTFPSPCMGPTGLSEDSNDTSEPPGCANPNAQDNFLAALDMQAGVSYALMVNNFSASGNGFAIEWGGTGEFVGPEAAFTSDEPDQTICVGESIVFTDQSSFSNGTITDWEWNFGPGANVSSANTQGPHEVSYNTPGVKSVILTISTDRECIVTEIATILVECCEDHYDANGVPSDVLCANVPDGSIDLTINSDYAPYTYTWSNGESTEDLMNLEAGDYSVTVMDESTCTVELDFTINSPEEITITEVLEMPTCGGGQDGSITLEVDGGVPPYQYNWDGMGFTNDNSLQNIMQGSYNVIVLDDNGCETEVDILLSELDLILDPTVEAVTPPSCDGFSDGSIVVNIVNGIGPFEYNWNDGNGFVDDNSLLNVAAGTYLVEVRDANLCQGIFEFTVEAPPALAIDFDIQDVSCNGADDGNILATPSGGVGNYAYSWSNGDSKETISDLQPGDYTLTITDGNGCEYEETVTVIEPNAVFIDIDMIEDVLCNGDSTGVISVIGSGGTPPFEYTIDGVNFQSEPSFAGLPAGNYELGVRDAEGCIVMVDATVTEPAPLIVDLGENIQINLGKEVDLQALANESPVTYSWSPTNDIIDILSADSSAIRILPLGTTDYTVTVTNEIGCTATDVVTVGVFKARPIYAPTAFSPNNDGVNDGWTLFGGPDTRIIKSLKIFNRWGSLVFETEDIPLGEPSLGWDGDYLGKPMQAGVFAYIAEVEYIDDVVVLFEGDFAIVK